MIAPSQPSQLPRAGQGGFGREGEYAVAHRVAHPTGIEHVSARQSEIAQASPEAGDVVPAGRGVQLISKGTRRGPRSIRRLTSSPWAVRGRACARRGRQPPQLGHSGLDGSVGGLMDGRVRGPQPGNTISGIMARVAWSVERSKSTPMTRTPT